MIDSLQNIPNIVPVPDVPDSDDESEQESNEEDSLTSLPDLVSNTMTLENDQTFNQHGGAQDDSEQDEQANTPRRTTIDDFLETSSALSESLERCRIAYRTSQHECQLLCGQQSGNLVIVPCGHHQYCLSSMANQC